MRVIPANVSDPGRKEAVTGGHGMSATLLVADFMCAVLADGSNPIDLCRGVEMTAPGICAHASHLTAGQPLPSRTFGRAKDYVSRDR